MLFREHDFGHWSTQFQAATELMRYLSQVGIGPLLLADRSWWPVARQNQCVVRKWKEFFADTLQENIRVAAWQVRSSNAAREQDIAGDQGRRGKLDSLSPFAELNLIGSKKDRQVVRSMAGRPEYLALNRPHEIIITFVEQAVGFRGILIFVRWQTVKFCLTADRAAKDWIRVCEKLDFRLHLAARHGQHRGRTAPVIDMAVSQQDADLLGSQRLND